MYNFEIVGHVQLGIEKLDVYSNLDAPLFLLTDVSNALHTDINFNFECDEVIKIDDCVFVTEIGLYNAIAQTNTELARAWKRVIFDQLVWARKKAGLDITEQFIDWTEKMNDIYFDIDTGAMMISITVDGGDVIQKEVDEL